MKNHPALPLSLVVILGLLAALAGCQQSCRDEPPPTATVTAGNPPGSGPSAEIGEPEVVPAEIEPPAAAVPGPPRHDTPSQSDLELWEYQLAVREVELDSRERKIAAREAAIAEEPASKSPQGPTTEAPAPVPAPEESAEPAPEDPEGESLLTAQDAAPAAGLESSRRALAMTLPAGTEFEVELLEALSSAQSEIGDPVRARLIRAITLDGTVVVPAGALVTGTVLEVDPGRKIAGRAQIVLAFERLQPPGGDAVAISASTADLGKDQRRKDAATIGGSAAGGAILGRVLSDKHRTKRSVLGAILGAAVGAAVASQTLAEPVELEAGTVLRLRLEEWARVSVEPAPPPAGEFP